MNILVYEGHFQYDVVNYFAKQIGEAFEKLGHTVVFYKIPNQAAQEKFISILIESNIEFIVSFNAIQGLFPDELNAVIEKYKIIVGNILVDHPFEHWRRIQMFKGENTFWCMYDEGYLKIFEDYIDNQEPIALLHHGGTEVEAKTSKKIYDVVMAGTMRKPGESLEELEAMPEGLLKAIGKSMYEEAKMHYDIPVDNILNKEIEKRNLDTKVFREDKEFQQAIVYIYNLVDVQIRSEMRYLVLETLLKAGINVDLFGNCKVDEFKNYSNLNYHGSIEYLKLLEEIAKSKILVNDFKTCNNGSHERILSSMLNECLVVSNKNNYCEGDYVHKKNIVYYDVNHLESLTEQVKYYLANVQEREEIVKAAYTLTSQKHTWTNRAYELQNIYQSFRKYKQDQEEEWKKRYKKISVIVPCYNVEKLVSRCIVSLLNQTIGLENMEVILVNDASTDQTLDVLLKHEKDYPNNIMVVNLENNIKQGGARNIGMHYASGDYIAFVDADDWVELNIYEKIYKKLIIYDCDVVSCRYIRQTNDQILEAKKLEKDTLVIADKTHTRKEILNQDFGGGVCCKLYKKSFINENNMLFPEFMSYEDNYWGALLRFYVNRFYLLEEGLYHYYVNLNSTIMTRNSLHHLDRTKIELMKIEFYKEKGVFGAYHEEIEAEFLQLFYCNTLHILFTRFDELPVEVIQGLQQKALELFPNYKQNKLLKHTFLLETFEKNMSKEEWEASREQYLKII